MESWNNPMTPATPSVEPPSSAEEALAQPPPTWNWLDGVFVLFGAFLIYIVGSVILGIVDFAIEGKHIGFWVIPASYLFLTVGTFFMIQIWLITHRQGSWRMVGFRVMHARSYVRGLGWLLLVALCGYIVTAIGSDIIVAIFDATSFHIKSNVKELLPHGQSTVSVAQFVTLLLMAGVLAPITEETLFRGALYQGVAKSIESWAGKFGGIAISAIVTGCVFGLFHLLGGGGELYTLPILAFLGIVLSLTFQFSGSLGGSMLVHASINSISIAVYYGAHLH